MNITNLFLKIKNNKKRYVYLITFMVLGITLMIFPGTSQKSDVSETTNESSYYSIEKEEKRLEQILSQINGVGECKVLLSIHTGTEQILAENEGETVVLSEGGKQTTVTVQTRYPPFQGAVIVSGGCTDASIRYDILSSVMSYTGLSVDKITICPIKNSRR